MSYKTASVSSFLVAIFSFSLWAADTHNNHAASHKSGHESGHAIEKGTAISTLPTEGGQSMFAAIIEMVRLLEQDPQTDWSRVDIDALRSHLLDMHHLVVRTEATQANVGDSQIQFNIHGDAQSISALHRMVPAHARYIQQSRGWIIDHVLNPAGATVTITVGEDRDLTRLAALGFYGFMSLDSHHQSHHLQIALGRSH